MTFNKETLECTCNRCGHIWRARTENIPKKCSKCTAINWNDSGKAYNVITARSCGLEENGKRLVLCILDRIERPDIITENIFYMKEEDINAYLRGASYPAGSAVVLIGDFVIQEDQELIVNDMKLIYIHEKAYRSYVSGVTCAYNIASYYERQKSYKRLEEIEANRQLMLAEKRKKNLAGERQRLLEEQARLDMRKQILAEIEAE